VVASDINGASAEETAAAIASNGPRALAIQADVGNTQDIDRQVREAVARFGKVDILVNNAGFGRVQTLGGKASLLIRLALHDGATWRSTSVSARMDERCAGRANAECKTE
jgi:NAD(P)-dependent dehydrogenase (short-subunit alcohol dehydrogenase family)